MFIVMQEFNLTEFYLSARDLIFNSLIEIVPQILKTDILKRSIE